MDAPPSRLSQRLAWARETLELETNASPAAIRARMLRLVTDEDFVPAEGCLQALRTLQADAAGAAELDDPPAFARDHQRRLDAEVESFAARIFRVPVAERQAQWQRLQAHGEQAIRARARLEQLWPGLAVDLSLLETQPDRIQQLGRQVCELFTLRPTERAIRRAELAQQAAEDRQSWEIAARQLQKEYREIAALDLELVRCLQTPPQTGVPLALRQPARKQEVVTRQTEDSGARWLWIVPLIIFLGVIRIAQIGNSDRSYNRPPTWQPSIPLDVPPVSTSKEEFDRLREALRRAGADFKLPPLPGERDPSSPFPAPVEPPTVEKEKGANQEQERQGDIPP